MGNEREDSVFPTLIHITHYKAGSTWILNILRNAFPGKVVQRQIGASHFLNQPVIKGRFYSPLYVTKQQFESVQLPDNCRKFIVIRDLRDTLISLYFSLKYSHDMLNEEMKKSRATLNSMSVDEGLIYMIKHNWLYPNTEIQKSWVESGEPIILYEDLLKNDILILEKILINECKLPIAKKDLYDVIKSQRFSKQTGRKPGIEDINSHNRKGIKGDWRNYFTEEIKEIFKEHYNDILVLTGYEKDGKW
ncbi:sulfotransferase domain-containing protein [Bacillus haimaensis]|uniref:sulfotransferase domain-containing protein n=1 Tax=Bacillus haimaensis TaxID=3160967 RepID=UPI003AA98AC1